MKKFFLALSLMLAVGLTTASANDETGISDKIKESFKKQFEGVESVEWKDLGEHKVARFVFRGHRVEAYFNTNGELEGAARFILLNELPLKVMRSLEKDFPGADFTNVLEVSNTEGSFYWVTVDIHNKQYRVKADLDGDVLEQNRIWK